MLSVGSSRLGIWASQVRKHTKLLRKTHSLCGVTQVIHSLSHFTCVSQDPGVGRS